MDFISVVVQLIVIINNRLPELRKLVVIYLMLQFVIRAVRGNGGHGDVAIDDLKITAGFCNGTGLLGRSLFTF